MTQQLYTVYDAKAEAYLQPFATNTHGLAERMFSEMVNTQGHQFNRFPEDYTLYHIGTFDTHTALVEPGAHTPIISGLQAVQASPQLVN